MEQLSTTDISDTLADKHGLSKKEAKEIVSSFLELIVDSVKKGNKVSLLGFGTFEKAHRKERKSTNPATGEQMTIAATDYPKFKVGTKFKQAVK